eukprot:scaffold68321_cov20-Tisochrysis_lutea.AAC.1
MPCRQSHSHVCPAHRPANAGNQKTALAFSLLCGDSTSSSGLGVLPHGTQQSCNKTLKRYEMHTVCENNNPNIIRAIYGDRPDTAGAQPAEHMGLQAVLLDLLPQLSKAVSAGALNTALGTQKSTCGGLDAACGTWICRPKQGCSVRRPEMKNAIKCV